jgi:hypothetical protein
MKYTASTFHYIYWNSQRKLVSHMPYCVEKHVEVAKLYDLIVLENDVTLYT